MKTTFSEIHQQLKSANRVLVVSHVRPDGDALGSTLAAALWLQQEGHMVTAWNEDGVPQKFSYLPEAALITKPSEQVQEFDAILILDTATKERLGKKVLASARSPLWLAIDHHLSNENFAHHNLVDPSSPATGEMLARGFLQKKITITPAMACNLYAAISTDTGSFQYSSTTERTFEIAAALVKAGVSVGSLSQAMYGRQPRRRLELLRHVLVNVKFSCDDRIASFALTRKDVAALSILPEDTEGITDCFRSVEGVEVALFLEELRNNEVRLSVRSQTASFNASEFCQQYGGGGHRMAAGATLQGSIQEVEEKTLKFICQRYS
jgi:phosphoesterase RecJ-like protein